LAEPPLLSVRGLESGYQKLPVLRGVDLDLYEGELLLIVGPNGAGKSTLMRTLIGLIRPWHGEIALYDSPVTKLRANRRARLGLAWVSEGRGIIPELTVEENLNLAKFGHDWSPQRRTQSLERFPVLARTLRRAAGTLSGGEQQMLAIARALETGSRVLLIDEPSLGLAPMIVNEVMNTLSDLVAEGHSILLVEQRAAQAERTASRTLLMAGGRLTEMRDRATFAEMTLIDFATAGGAGQNA
jgi:branched-chain amino acid transport system ATP-binding protein